MAENPRSSKHTGRVDVEKLRAEAVQARSQGDETRAAQLEEQIREAEKTPE
jgi:hypothetical protein